MLNEPSPLRRRIYDRLVADRGPGRKKLWVLIAIPLGILAGLAGMALLGLYIWLARGLPSIEWARHYRPPIVTTRRLENNFDKEHIVWLYLNEVYFGHHSYGVQAAAENYFRKNVWELSLPEISLIAGLPQAPSKYSPFAHPERSKARRMYVLRRMFEEGMITAQERKEAEDAPIQVSSVQD